MVLQGEPAVCAPVADDQDDDRPDGKTTHGFGRAGLEADSRGRQGQRETAKAEQDGAEAADAPQGEGTEQPREAMVHGRSHLSDLPQGSTAAGRRGSRSGFKIA
ncbi:hypothetical protein [uncultured Methylobacterium sp.]|uniref:hypothetical protein n=1 Tax=uncultured Methylobacterium sp. TaxID=157278 RepID=UPI00258DA688|nr:hypothetical protein [uncultured Methylobacterium sp.]